ncbi:MAG: hypothetical protein HFE78_06815 [Clostridiales bacterium]|nr:hypothetical protein [Clostridiales bacterium]
MSKTPHSIKDNQARKSKRRFILLTFIAFFILLSSLSFAAIGFSLYHENLLSALERNRYYYQLGIDKLSDTLVRRVDADDLYRNGQLYLSMDDVVKLCELTVTGDHTKRTYFPTDASENYVTFYFNSSQIIVNGEKMLMEGDTFVKGNVLYVPASFFQNYASGIEVIENEEKKRVTVQRVSLGTKYDVLGEMVQDYQEITFLAGTSQSLTPISEGIVISAFPEPKDDPSDSVDPADGTKPDTDTE